MFQLRCVSWNKLCQAAVQCACPRVVGWYGCRLTTRIENNQASLSQRGRVRARRSGRCSVTWVSWSAILPHLMATVVVVVSACERPSPARTGRPDSGLVRPEALRATGVSSETGADTGAKRVVAPPEASSASAAEQAGIGPGEPRVVAASEADLSQTELTKNAVEGPMPVELYRSAIGIATSGRRTVSDRFAGLQPWECRKELRRRGISVRSAGMLSPGVASPVRLDGPVGTIRFVGPGSKSKYGILDCRLALLLGEVATLLEALAVKEVYVGNFYRPNSRLPKKNLLSQHAHGLALDIFAFKMTDGTVLSVENDFDGVLGGAVCGSEAAFSSKNRKSILLRNVVCELARVGAFNYLLTPNYDEPHRNHLHADIKRGTRDHVVR